VLPSYIKIEQNLHEDGIINRLVSLYFFFVQSIAQWVGDGNPGNLAIESLLLFSLPLTMIMTELDKSDVLDQPSLRYPFTIVRISKSCEILKEGTIFACHLTEDRPMNVRLPILLGLIVSCYLSIIPTQACAGQHPYRDSLFLLANNWEGSSPVENSKETSLPGVEKYEKEKLAKLRGNIGKRYLTVKTINPAEFYESPDDLEKKLMIKGEKEGFVITEVVQNRSGTMNFYRVKFDTGQVGYLSADGIYLEIKIKEGSLISVPKRVNTQKKSLSQSKALSSQAVELVKNHPTPAGSVEKRMMDERAKSFPYPRWTYEAKEIGGKKFRILQYVEERSAPPFIRKWIVDLSIKEVRPENLAAKEMYR